MNTKILKLLMKTCLWLSVAFMTTTAYAEGKALDLSAYKGKVVYVDFWASWCPPCRQSFPWLNEMNKTKAADGLVVLGINVDANPEDAAAFLKKYPAEFEMIFDAKGEYPSYYDIPTMPTSVIFDREGNRVYLNRGFKLGKVAEYEAAIDKVLMQP